MVSLKRIRNFSVLVVILISFCLVFEQAKMINSVCSENIASSELEKQAQNEPSNDGNLEALSAVNITEYGSWDGNLGNGRGTVTYNQYTILITNNEVHVIDKTDLANPVLVSSWHNLTEGLNYYDFKLRGDFLYLLDSFSKVTMVDISDIENFEVVSIAMVGYTTKMKLHEDLLFVYDSSYKLLIYNISSTSTMEFITEYIVDDYFSSSINDFEIINQTAYFICDNGLQIYNLTNPDNIMKIGNTTSITGDNNRISVKDDLVFIGTMNHGIIVYNTTNTTNPTFLYNFLNETSDNEYAEWYFIDDYLLVFNKMEGLILCDATNLSDIFYIQSTEFNRSFYIEKYLNTLTIVTFYKYVYYTDISDILNIITLGSFDMGGNCIGVVTQGNFAYLANGGSGLEIISVANPDNPIKVANVYLNSSYADGVCVSNDLAFVACFFDGVYIIDIANPLQPIILSKYESTLGIHYYYDLAITENLLFIANGNAGVEIVDVSIPSSPYLINSFNTDYSFAQSIDIQNDIAAVVDGILQLTIFDVSSPIHPIQLSTVHTYDWAPREVKIEGDFVYVLNYYDGFSIIDIEKTFDPQVVIHYDIPGIDGFRDIDVWGEYVYVTSYHDGLFVADCFDKEAPILIQRYDNSDIFFEIFVYNSYVFIANSFNGLLIFSANKTKLNGYEIPVVAFILSIGLITCYFFNKKRKRKQS
ncbi:MAG: hypothetical protein ACTSVP_13350 [Candidatus Heimdallarchaeota archaeon]